MNTLTNSPVDLSKSNIDANDALFQDFLSELQANIIKGHGREYAYHIFLKLNASKIPEAKAWISAFAKSNITSALRLEHGRQAHKLSGADGGAVFSLSISATGYKALGFESTNLPVEMETPANSIVGDAAAFLTGAKASAQKLGDGNPETDWEEPFRGDVDILIIAADSMPCKALELSTNIFNEVSQFSTVLLNQKGQVLHRKVAITESFSNAINVEHFGYADGVSQPLFLKDEIDNQPSTTMWNDQEPLNLVLVPDTLGKTPDSFGSFLVFRKLEQNVAAFMDAEAAAGAIKDNDGVANKDLPGAMMVGRFRNGNVTVNSHGLTGNITRHNQLTNDFDYSNDVPPTPGDTPMYSSKCPFFAHTRATNPRADIKIAGPVTPQFIHSVRLTRRAIPYQDIPRFGPALVNLTLPTEEQLDQNRPSKGVGLLFMSYQAHIGKQFEFIQNNWANHGHIAGRNIGQDGVIGQVSPVPHGLPFVPAAPDLMNKKLPGQWGIAVETAVPDISFGQFVKNLGGEYFFTPSISFLKSLNNS